MNVDIRLPNITATNPEGQLSQMRSYIYQFAEQMQWALNTMGDGTVSQSVELKNSAGKVIDNSEEAKAQDTFNSIKDLIIKSADIVQAYYEKMDLLYLQGEYVAESDFGNYKEETDAKLEATSEDITVSFSRIEEIEGDIGMVREQKGYIRFGNDVTTTLQPDGTATGIEIGEFDTLNGVTKSRFAAFTSSGIELYGQSQTVPVAIISQHKITISNAEFNGDYVKMGKYKLDFHKGIAFKWVEVEEG